MDNKKLMALTGVVCILPVLAGLIIYGSLPAEMPVQWSMGGQVSSYAPKWFPVFGMPCFLFLFNIFCHVKVNKADKELSYPELAKVFIKWAMPVISVGMTAFTFAFVREISVWVILAEAVVSVLMVLFGWLVYDGKADGAGSREFPWGRSEKAAKLSGKIFMAAGMAAALMSVLGNITAALAVLVCGAVLAVMASSRG